MISGTWKLAAEIDSIKGDTLKIRQKHARSLARSMMNDFPLRHGRPVGRPAVQISHYPRQRSCFWGERVRRRTRGLRSCSLPSLPIRHSSFAHPSWPIFHPFLPPREGTHGPAGPALGGESVAAAAAAGSQYVRPAFSSSIAPHPSWFRFSQAAANGRSFVRAASNAGGGCRLSHRPTRERGRGERKRGRRRRQKRLVE